MRWEGQRESENVEDVRGQGGFGGLPIGGRGLSLGSVVVALIVGWIFGINPLALLGLVNEGGPAVVQQAPSGQAPADDPQVRFVSTVLADTEDVWTQQFRQLGADYREPKLVVYRGAYPTACGTGQAAMGPFYCPGDQKIYIDLSFYDVMRQRLGAPGDFAQAYVIAHEVGHHVQNLLGLTDRIDALRGRAGQAQQNALSVRLELQADCFAGLWAHHAQRARNILEQGDLEEALNAASQIGDDALQRRSQGTVVPESFTHGTSAQRVSWFKRGLQSGSVEQCDTFEAAR